MTATDDDTNGHTSAVIASSLCWDLDAIRRGPQTQQRQRFQDEAIRWQLASQRGSGAEMSARVTQTRQRWRQPPMNRLVELHGLMGAIGEQAGLCWTLEQDAQRFAITPGTREAEHQRLVLRALAESAGHFLLGAAHSVGNLGLRLSLLNANAAAAVNKKHPKANGFPPGTNERPAWLTLHEADKSLWFGAQATANKHLIRVSEAIHELESDPRFKQLDNRRGMDYHRQRPQSVAHASPKGGTVSTSGGVTTLRMVAEALDPDADGAVVHHVVVQAMAALKAAMSCVRTELPPAIRKERVIYNQRLSRPRRS